MSEHDDGDDHQLETSAPPVLKLAREGPGAPTYGSYAKAVVKARARLRGMFTIDVVNGPAFDMILRIFTATEEGEALSVTALGLAAEVPHASTVRWVHLLEVNGIIRRIQDPDDQRRKELALTAKAETVLREWLADISSIPLKRE